MGNEMFNDEQLAYLKDQAKAADLAAARSEAELFLSVGHEWDGPTCIRALEIITALLAATPEPAPNVCEKCGYVGPVIEHPHCNYLAGRIGDWPPEPAPALPDEVREAAEMLNLTIRMRETKHSCADRACSNVALGALNLLAAPGGRS